jgi:UDP-2,3-diacylglucosamine pyrophosphatase LpxH
MVSEEKDRNYVFVSDLHLSEGFLVEEKHYHRNEDFFYDDAFARFLAYLQKQREDGKHKKPWRLVINGDFIDFLQVTTAPNPENDGLVFVFRDSIRKMTDVEYDENDLIVREKDYKLGLTFTEPMSVWKLKQVVHGHPKFFDALAHFLDNGNDLVIIKGNHDAEFTYSKVREYFRRFLDERIPAGKPSKNVFFSRWFYYEEGLFYAEHGGQYDDANRYVFFLDPTMVRKPPKYSKLPTLRFPFGSFFVRYIFNQIEAEVPFADNVRPRAKAVWWIISHRPWFALWQLGKVIEWLRKMFRVRFTEKFNVLAYLDGLRTTPKWYSRPLYSILWLPITLISWPRRNEYINYKIKNLLSIFDMEDSSGIIPENGGLLPQTDMSITKMVKIYYRSFTKKAFSERTDKDIASNLTPLLQPVDISPPARDGGKPGKVINRLDKILGSAAEPPRVTSSRIFKYWNIGACITAVIALAAAIMLFAFNHPIIGSVVTGVAIIAFLTKGLGTEIYRLSTGSAPEKYLNSAARGVARILDVPYVIFGHTHVAYIKPIEKTDPSGPVRQWEVNTGSWTPVFDERMMLRQTGDEFPFVQLITEGTYDPSPELLAWNDGVGEPEKIRYAGE